MKGKGVITLKYSPNCYTNLYLLIWIRKNIVSISLNVIVAESGYTPSLFPLSRDSQRLHFSSSLVVRLDHVMNYTTKNVNGNDLYSFQIWPLDYPVRILFLALAFALSLSLQYIYLKVNDFQTAELHIENGLEFLSHCVEEKSHLRESLNRQWWEQEITLYWVQALIFWQCLLQQLSILFLNNAIDFISLYVNRYISLYFKNIFHVHHKSLHKIFFTCNSISWIFHKEQLMGILSPTLVGWMMTPPHRLAMP